MVTTQEINQAENQLSQVESQARQQAQSKIPRRRFGTRVTSQQQQNILKQRQEAEQTLRQVGEQRQKLQSLRQDISSQEATDNKLSYISKLANSSIPINLLKAQRKDYGLSKNDVANIQEIREGQLNIQKIKDQQAQFNREGIKPITNSQGQIVGFLDENRQQSIPIENITKIASSSSEDYNRYVRAGIIKAEPTIREQIQLQSLTPEERSQVVLSKEVMSYREPVQSNQPQQQSFKERLVGGGVRVATKIGEEVEGVPIVRAVRDLPLRKGFQFRNPYADLGNYNLTLGQASVNIADAYYDFVDRLVDADFTNKYQPSFLKYGDDARKFISKTALISVPFIVAPEFAIPVSVVSGTQRLTKGQTPQDKLTGLIELSTLVFEAGRISKNYFREPITIKAKAPEVELYSQAIQRDINTGVKLNTEALFTIKAFQDSQASITISRGRFIVERIKSIPFSDGLNNRNLRQLSGRLNIDELIDIFPKGKVSLSPQRFGFIKTDAFAIDEGIIKGIDKGFPTYAKVTGKIVNGQPKISKNTIGVFEGQSSKQNINLKLLTEFKLNKLDPTTRSNIRDLLKRGEIGEVQIAFLNTKDLIDLKGNKIIIPYPTGKSISRTQLAGTSELKASFEGNNIILEKFTDEIAGIDITFPRFRESRKIVRISGDTTRIYKEAFEEDNLINIYSPKQNIERTPFSKTFQIQNTKALQQAIASAGVTLEKSIPKINTNTITKSITESNVEFLRIQALPRMVGGGGQVTLPKPSKTLYSVDIEYVNLGNRQPTKNLLINPTKFGLQSREVVRLQEREIARDISRDINKEILKEIARLEERQIARSLARTLTRDTIREVPSINTPTKIKIPSNNFPLTTKFKSNLKDIDLDLTKGFKTYFFVGGKKIYLSGLSPREQAILKGQRATLKSLSARFGIEETNKLIKDSNVTATKDYNKFFREYKIMQNKTIKTPNIFIQKRGKRLVSKAERQLIQSARKNKRR